MTALGTLRNLLGDELVRAMTMLCSRASTCARVHATNERARARSLSLSTRFRIFFFNPCKHVSCRASNSPHLRSPPLPSFLPCAYARVCIRVCTHAHAYNAHDAHNARILSPPLLSPTTKADVGMFTKRLLESGHPLLKSSRGHLLVCFTPNLPVGFTW